ncbi:L-Lysine-8-amino-7-oxononanoate aminotransferase [compost metagenome]
MNILHTDCPHHYRYALPGESEEAFATRCAHSLDRLIESEGPDTVAAFFAEPVMASGGVIVPPATYFEKVQHVLRKHDVMLVADEVITGFGRTGNLFGAQTYGMQPDMISLAKQLSAGYLPISALLISDTIYRALTVQSEKIGTFSHGFTYSGHPVAAAVALETLRIYEDDGIVEHVRKVMPRFQQRLAEMGEHPLVGEARGVGLLGAVELVADKSTKMPFPTEQAVAARVGEFAKQRGVITRALGDTVNFCPPLIITESQIDEMFDKVELAMDDTMSWLASVA